MTSIRTILASATTAAALTLGVLAAGAQAPAAAQTRDAGSSQSQPVRTFDIADWITHRKEMWAASGPQQL